MMTSTLSDLGVRPVTPACGPVLPVVATGIAVPDTNFIVTESLLRGFHNRDWPSLWALSVLGEEAADGPVTLRQFNLEASSRAWKIADAIADAAGADRRQATNLLPTNRNKRDGADKYFQNFAIGTFTFTGRPDRIRAEGPLPAWAAVGVTIDPDFGILIGLTEAGWELLDAMAGLDAVAPHSERYTLTFFEYLGRHAPGDLWGFRTILNVIADRPTRTGLVNAFHMAGHLAGHRWTDRSAASTAGGYLARAREWGLVEQDMIDGSYRLTGLGRDFASCI